MRLIKEYKGYNLYDDALINIDPPNENEDWVDIVVIFDKGMKYAGVADSQESAEDWCDTA